MRLPAVAAALDRARATAARFPLALASGAAAAVALMAQIEGPERPWMTRLLAAGLLGLPLFTALATAAERRALTGPRRWLPAALLAAGLVAFAFLAMGWTDRHLLLRTVQLLAAAHLLVAILAFRGERNQLPFWQFNRILFLGYLLAALYAVVLWVGLAIALLAIDKLLGVDVPSRTYPHLLVLLAFVFHPWFFLSRVPEDHRALDQETSYPLGLKVFTQFVLIPLVAVYLVILTMYLGRVLVTRTWPSGWIGWLVSSVSLAGVLALLLVHPIRERADSRWVNGYGRWFFVALLPSLGMLLAAVGQRIGQYGVTEPRYFLLVLALWLAGLALYYGVTASRSIKLIPVTLCLVAVATAIGPWSAFAVSRRSQVARLAGILAANGMGTSGAATRASTPVSEQDQREVSAVLLYLRRNHGPDAVRAALGAPADSVRVWTARDPSPRAGVALEAAAMEWLGLKYLHSWSPVEDGRFFSLGLRDRAPIDVAGFDSMVPIHLGQGTTFETDSLVLTASPDLGSVTVRRAGSRLGEIDLATAVAEAVGRRGAGLVDDPRLESPVVAEREFPGLRLRLVLQHVSGERRPEGLRTTTATGFLLIRRTSPSPVR